MLPFIIFIFFLFITPIKNYFYDYSVKIGFNIENIDIEGSINSDISIGQIKKKIGIEKKSIFSVNLKDLEKSILSNNWVRSCYSYISLPSTIKIIITEKKPIAMWQNNGRLSIIDKNGFVITSIISNKYSFLPLIIGDNANINASKLFQEINKSPELKKHITNYIYVGSRRWDLIIKDKILVQMPEGDFTKAYEYLDLIFKRGKIDKFKKLDLRDKSKFYITKAKSK